MAILSSVISINVDILVYFNEPFKDNSFWTNWILAAWIRRTFWGGYLRQDVRQKWREWKWYEGDRENATLLKCVCLSSFRSPKKTCSLNWSEFGRSENAMRYMQKFWWHFDARTMTEWMTGYDTGSWIANSPQHIWMGLDSYIQNIMETRRHSTLWHKPYCSKDLSRFGVFTMQLCSLRNTLELSCSKMCATISKT